MVVSYAVIVPAVYYGYIDVSTLVSLSRSLSSLPESHSRFLSHLLSSSLSYPSADISLQQFPATGFGLRGAVLRTRFLPLSHLPRAILQSGSDPETPSRAGCSGDPQPRLRFLAGANSEPQGGTAVRLEDLLRASSWVDRMDSLESVLRSEAIREFRFRLGEYGSRGSLPVLVCPGELDSRGKDIDRL